MHTLASLIEHALLLIFNIGRRVVFHRGLMMFECDFWQNSQMKKNGEVGEEEEIEEKEED